MLGVIFDIRYQFIEFSHIHINIFTNADIVIFLFVIISFFVFDAFAYIVYIIYNNFFYLETTVTFFLSFSILLLFNSAFLYYIFEIPYSILCICLYKEIYLYIACYFKLFNYYPFRPPSFAVLCFDNFILLTN